MKRAAHVLALAITIAVAGCGKDPDPNQSVGPADLTPFVGTWNVAAAGLTVTCTDHSTKAIAINQPTVLVMGTDSDLLDTDATCPVKYKVTGRIARALPQQTCDEPQLPTQMHVLDDTFTVDDTGMATHEASGNLDGFINIALGESVKCTFAEMGIYRRADN